MHVTPRISETETATVVNCSSKGSPYEEDTEGIWALPVWGGVSKIFLANPSVKRGLGTPQIRKLVSAKNKSVKEGVGLPPKTVNHKNGAFGVFSRLAARKISFSVRKGGSRGTLLT